MRDAKEKEEVLNLVFPLSSMLCVPGLGAGDLPGLVPLLLF